MNRPDNAPVDPEDSAHSLASFWALRACELLCACMFATALPWHQPFAWFGMIGVLGTLRWVHVNRPEFKAMAKPRRQRVYRFYVWLLMAFVGSSCYFLYVPGNLPIQAVLLSYLLGNATLIAVRVTGDAIRTITGLCLAVVPTSIRCIVDGYGDDSPLLMLMGVGGVLMTFTIASLSRAQDRSVRHQVEQRRRAESAAQAVAAVGLAKSRFFAAVSHDLRQPVHAIGLYLEPLAHAGSVSADKAAGNAVEGIRQSWRALDDLLQQVLDLTRMDSGMVTADLRPTEIAPLVQSLLRQHNAVAERAGVRIVSLVRPRRYALADDLMLMRVLSNLLDNAIKFSARGSLVALVMRNAGEEWKIQVRDAGIGIPEPAQDRIFEEFVQLDNDSRDRRRGLGLGLAIAKRFALLMNGNLEVRSELGRGCCMTVTLPKAAPPTHAFGTTLPRGPAATSRPVAPRLEVELASREVLLVEDDLLVAAATCDLLRSWGLSVRHVETAAEALKMSAPGQFGLCDARLPHNASGLDLALQLQEAGMRVLLISGETTSELREAALQHKVPLLTKPVSASALHAALQAL